MGTGKTAVPRTRTDKYMIWRVAERWQTRFPNGPMDVLSLSQEQQAALVAWERIRIEEEAC